MKGNNSMISWRADLDEGVSARRCLLLLASDVGFGVGSAALAALCRMHTHTHTLLVLGMEGCVCRIYTAFSDLEATKQRSSE